MYEGVWREGYIGDSWGTKGQRQVEAGVCPPTIPGTASCIQEELPKCHSEHGQQHWTESEVLGLSPRSAPRDKWKRKGVC